MPKFFVPNTESTEDAEEAYSSMRKHNYIGEEKPGRLVRIVFGDGEPRLSLPKLVASFAIFLSPPTFLSLSGKSSRSLKRQMW